MLNSDTHFLTVCSITTEPIHFFKEQSQTYRTAKNTALRLKWSGDRKIRGDFGLLIRPNWAR